MMVLFTAISLYMGVVGLFLLLVTLGSWFHRPFAGKNKKHSFLMVIPAHNEAGQIEKCLRTIQASNYPNSAFRVAVIADNCTDNTAEIAAVLGAVVFQRKDPDHKSKGYALDWFFSKHKQAYENFDGICIVDADSYMEKRFLREMNKALSQPGVRVVQAFNGVANTRDNWRTALTTCALNVFNHLRMAGSVVCFGSGILKGNGMCFRSEWLLEMGWPAHGLVEDLELSCLLADQGIDVQYQPSAVITSDMPVNKAQANIQRERWENGRLSMLPNFFKSLAKGHLHLAFDMMTPPLSLYVLLFMFWSALALLVGAGAIFFPLVIALVLIFYVVSAQIQRRLSLKHWLYFASLPLFIWWKGALYLKWLFGKQIKNWQRTPRPNE